MIDAEKWVECTACGGDCFVSHDCGEDTCCCLNPEKNVACAICHGSGGWIEHIVESVSEVVALLDAERSAHAETKRQLAAMANAMIIERDQARSAYALIKRAIVERDRLAERVWLLRVGLKCILEQPFDGSWDAQAVYVQDILTQDDQRAGEK